MNHLKEEKSIQYAIEGLDISKKLIEVFFNQNNIEITMLFRNLQQLKSNNRFLGYQKHVNSHRMGFLIEEIEQLSLINFNVFMDRIETKKEENICIIKDCIDKIYEHTSKKCLGIIGR